MLDDLSNVAALTAQLSKLTPQQLQQYAAQAAQQNDAVGLSMASYVSNKRQQMAQRMQGQNAMAQPPQPTVAEQTIASMAPPEAMGIHALPADNLRGMAEGGIVAFDEGGDVSLGRLAPLAALAGGSYTLAQLNKMAPGLGYRSGADLARALAKHAGSAAGQAVGSTLPKTLLGRTGALGALGTTAVTTAVTPTEQYRERFGLETDSPTFFGDLGIRALGAASDLADAGTFGYLRNKVFRDTPPAAVAPKPKKGAPVAAPPGVGAATPPAAQGVAGAPGATPKRSGAGPATPAQPSEADELTKKLYGRILEQQDLQSLYSSLIPKETVDPFAARQEAINAANVKAREQDLAAFDEDAKNRGLAFLDRERRLKEKEGKLGKEAGENKNLALLQAGLAMMAGTSPHALTNIGAGAQVGLKAYTDGQKRIQEAKEKLDDAFGRIEEFRRNEDTLTSKERRAYKSAINTASTEGLEKLLASMRTQYGVDRSTAGSLLQSYVSREGHNTQAATSLLNSREQAAATVKAAGIRASGDRSAAQDIKLAQLWAKVQSDVASELAKDMQYGVATEAEKARMFQQKVLQRLRSNPALAQYVSDSGEAPPPVAGGFRVVGVRDKP